MNAPLSVRAILFCALVLTSQAGEPAFSLQLPHGRVRAVWSLPPGGPDHSLTTRRWQLERSTDMGAWTPEGAPVVAAPGGAGVAVLDMAPRGTHEFFRLLVTDEPAFLASGGGEAMGFVTAMDERMAANGSITPQNFAPLFPGAPCLPQVSYDVSKSEYWAEWNANPAVWNAALPPGSLERRLTDFRLNAAGLTLLQRNGFVVSEARGAPGFTDLYYRIWTDDLPVYVSSDSILHAWHRTWITMLEELEELALRERVMTLVTGLHTHLTAAKVPAALTQGRTDALSYINTAQQLVNYLGTNPVPSQGTQYGRAVRADSVGLMEPFFGEMRIVDWTQFGPRAHYGNSETLKSYFRTMMWLGLIDMRLDQRTPAPENAPRQLSAAVVLTLALNEAGLMDEWEELDSILTPFTGRADALTPPQLLEILTAEGLGSPAAFTGPATLETLLARIMSGQAGVQQIAGHPIPAPLGEVKVVLPRSFVLFPQRFTPESWAFSRMVFDNIWREAPPGFDPPMVRVRRRLPSALDIDFAVLGNDTPAALLSQRMTTPGVPFRDGYDFSRELVSERQVMDAAGPVAWSGSLYLHCLDALRSLSAPLPSVVPEAMRTEAWKWKTVQTQLAGWTELRHDHLLYAKQSYTGPVLCDYPAGYVEPRPAFYAAMKRMVDFALTAVSALPMNGIFPARPGTPEWAPSFVDLATRKAEWLTQFAGMSGSMQSLQELAQRELDRQPFTRSQSDFLRSLVQSTSESYSNDGRTYSGWYPRLYLKSVFAATHDFHPSEMWDPLVVDVHTDGPDVIAGDPGAVLYNATGNAALMLVCIDVNGQRCLHGGPVFTYYEFTGPWGTERLTDQAWKSKVAAREQPAHPEWTASFLVPGPITVPPAVQ